MNMNLDLLFNIIGYTGVAMILIAYSLLQLGSILGDSIRYCLANLVGAILILVSLCWSWNWPSVVIEVAWILISLFGLIKALRKHYKDAAS